MEILLTLQYFIIFTQNSYTDRYITGLGASKLFLIKVYIKHHYYALIQYYIAEEGHTEFYGWKLIRSFKEFVFSHKIMWIFMHFPES